MEQAARTHTAPSDNWSRLWEWIAGVIINPVETFREIADRTAWQQALLVVVAVAAVNALIQAASVIAGVGTTFAQFDQFGAEFGPAGDPFTGFGPTATGIGVASAFAEIFWRPIMWTVVTLVLYLIATLLGGRGDFTRLWAVLGFASIPELVVAPFSAGVSLLAVLSPALSLIGSIVLVPISLAVFVWIVVLYVLGVREAMRLTTGSAVATVLLPVLALIVLVILFLCLIAALIFAFIGGTSGW